MTPTEFFRAIEKACESSKLDEVVKAGAAAMREALGPNSPAYLDGIDKLCRRMRVVAWRKSYGAPTAATVGKPPEMESAL